MKKKINLFFVLFGAIALCLSAGFILKIQKHYNEYPNHKLSPSERAFYFAELEFLKTRDPKTDALPNGIKEKEIRFASLLPTKENYYSMKRKASGTIQTQTWISRGPLNVTGRMNAVAYDVANSKIINAGGASGGMWRSLDGGVSWVKTSQPNINQSVYCIAQDTRAGKNNIWYYGTGELLSTTDRKMSTNRRTIGYGNGIFKSTDNGSTWFLLQSTQTSVTGSLGDVFQGVWNITVDPNSSNDVVFAACYGSIMRSTDGGLSWNSVLGDMTNKSYCTDIAITKTGEYYAALSDYSQSGITPSKMGVFHSKDGITWENISPPGFPENTRTIRLAVAPSNENIVYLLTDSYYPGYDPIVNFTVSVHTFWKFTFDPSKGKGTWEDRRINLPQNITGMNDFNSLGGYCIVLKVYPKNENVVFLGGTNLYRSTNAFADKIQIKELGGYKTYNVSDPYGNNLHPDIHALAFDPGNADILLVGNDGGLHITDNCLKVKVEWNGLKTGIQTTQFYSVGIVPDKADDNFIIGGLQDNFTQFTNSDNSSGLWKAAIGGDGMTVAVASNNEYAIGCCQYGEIYSILFSPNGDLQNVLYQKPDVLRNYNFNFFTTFALAPNGKTFYLPVLNQLWRKDDMATAATDTNLRNLGWSEILTARITWGESIVSVTVSKNPANIVYFGTTTGKVYRIDDADKVNPGTIDITGSNFPKGGYVVCVEADPEDAEKVFAVFSNYNVQSIFYSTDGGGSWSAQGGNLEENQDGSGSGPSIRWLRILHFQNKTIYFAGTSVGLFSTQKLDGINTVWLQEGASNIGNTIIDDIEVRENDGLVVVGTQGYGVFSTNVNLTGVEDEHESSASFESGLCYPNPANDLCYLDLNSVKSGIAIAEIFDYRGYVQKTLKINMLTGKNRIQFKTHDLSNGCYFIRLQCPDGVISRIFFIDN